VILLYIMERERLIKYKKADMFFKILLEGTTAQKTFQLNSIAEKFKGYVWVVVEQASIEGVDAEGEQTIFFHSNMSQPFSQASNKNNNMNSALFYFTVGHYIGTLNYEYAGNNYSGSICNFTTDSIDISVLDSNNALLANFQRWFITLKVYPLYED
jgi:hypothetical protein